MERDVRLAVGVDDDGIERAAIPGQPEACVGLVGGEVGPGHIEVLHSRTRDDGIDLHAVHTHPR